MNIIALPKKLYDRATELGVTSIALRFSGGSDEGYLDVQIDSPLDNDDALSALGSDVEDWADTAYSYSGHGDGSDYGDNVTYDLVEMEARWDEWEMKITEGDSGSQALEIEPEEAQP
jgi:hypothetical protein